MNVVCARKVVLSALLVCALAVTTACQPDVATGTGSAQETGAGEGAPVEEGDVTVDPADLLAEFGCEYCTEPFHEVTGFAYAGEAARLILAHYTTPTQDEFGADTKVAAYYVRDSDNELLADNVQDRPNTGLSFVPDVPFDHTWAIDDAGSFFLLTQDVNLAEQQGIAWLNQDDLESVADFAHAHIPASGQSVIEIRDLDGDGAAEVAGQWGPVTYLHPDRDVVHYFKYHPDTSHYHPWKCAESTDDGETYPDPVALVEPPCADFPYTDLPWDD